MNPYRPLFVIDKSPPSETGSLRPFGVLLLVIGAVRLVCPSPDIETCVAIAMTLAGLAFIMRRRVPNQAASRRRLR